ncbi:isoleucyl-tRNA synthetase [Chryseobacterium koreense CCUG 49689]|uniref:Isoleucyl-tRNA synthetase n=2 Tax=Chryseobacterium koreense TaxID=232216 RepID=A0A0J7IZJ0_9FLAO|nr:isoleucyl-tRNA synthetase [Chryseobacterium koreense CCUG 49689]
MKKSLLFLLLISVSQTFAQVITSSKWSDLFSYNNVLEIREDAGKLIAATENGIFYYTPATGEIKKLSKANGLHEVKISAFDYNPDTKIGLVGYSSGSMDIISPEGITFVVDIPIATGYMGDKKINHIHITGNLAVISVGYGVSIFKLDKKEFGDSAFFNNGGVYDAARESVIKGDTVYSLTSTGLKTHKMDVTFPIYSTWNTAASGNFTQISLSTAAMAYANSTTVFVGDGTTFNAIPKTFNGVKDVVATPQNIIVADSQTVQIFSTTGAFVKSYDASESLNTGFYSNSVIYAGTVLSGMKKESGEILKPDGPYNNFSYKITVNGSELVVSTGFREARFNFAGYNPKNLGFYYFNGSEWIYPSYFKNNPIQFNVLDAVQNPSVKTDFFFTNYNQNTGQGIYRMKYNPGTKDFDFQKYYSLGNNYSYNRPVGLTYTDTGILYATASYYTPTYSNHSTGYLAFDPSSDSFNGRNLLVAPNGEAVQKAYISEGYLWIPFPRSNNFGAVDYKNTQPVSDDQIYVIQKDQGLPSNSGGTLSFTIDKNGDGWIGTESGLRILRSAATEIKNTPTVEPIIIEQNGLGEELFRDSIILQIEVDSGNQKWVSIDGGGVFYLSSTGEQTILHFTKENSPLPTNSVTDIKVDSKTGKVYFVTADGIMVYQGDVLDVTSNFGDVLVYPNPVVYANYKGNVRIRGLADKTNIRITDAAGNLVHQAVARGGYYEWDLNNQRGVRVASGIYFVLMTNADATDKATAKIAVVN